VQAEHLQSLLPAELRSIFDGVLDTRERRYYGELLRAFAQEQPATFASLLEHHRSDRAGMQRRLERLFFSPSASDAIVRALCQSDSRRRVSILLNEPTVTPVAVTAALAGADSEVQLRLTDSDRVWGLRQTLAKMGAAGMLDWLPSPATPATMPKLLDQVVGWMFSSEGGSEGGEFGAAAQPGVWGLGVLSAIVCVLQLARDLQVTRHRPGCPHSSRRSAVPRPRRSRVPSRPAVPTRARQWCAKTAWSHSAIRSRLCIRAPRSRCGEGWTAVRSGVWGLGFGGA
jgi:hypothetical protein